MALRFGRMNKRLTILRRSAATRNALNEPVESFAEVGKAWAHQMEQRPTESWKAGQTAAQHETAWRVRWSPVAAAITPLDRVECGGRIYEITGVTEVGRREAVDIIGIAKSEEGLDA